MSRSTDGDGWFSTRDEGYLHADRFLFVRGRADDTIIRGGENIAPAEIEEVILQIPEVAVAGLPSAEWGSESVPSSCPGLTRHSSQVFTLATLRQGRRPENGQRAEHGPGADRRGQAASVRSRPCGSMSRSPAMMLLIANSKFSGGGLPEMSADGTLIVVATRPVRSASRKPCV